MTVVADISARLSADREQVNSAFVTAVFEYGTGIVGLLSDWGYQAGQNAKLEIEVARGAAQVFTEGQSLPSPAEGTSVSASFAFKAFRSVIRESGHERRARGPNDEGMRIQNPEYKMGVAIRGIRDLMAQTFDDAATYGVQGVISAGTYAFGDQSRTTYAALKSYELNASSAALSTALLNKFVTLSKDTPYGTNFDAIILSATQAHKLGELVSGKLAIPAVGGQTDLIPTDFVVAGAPVMVLPNLTSSVVLGLSGLMAGEWGFVWNIAAPGRFDVLDLGAANSDTPLNLQVSSAGAMLCNYPQKQGKLYGLSTG